MVPKVPARSLTDQKSKALIPQDLLPAVKGTTAQSKKLALWYTAVYNVKGSPNIYILIYGFQKYFFDMDLIDEHHTYDSKHHRTIPYNNNIHQHRISHLILYPVFVRTKHEKFLHKAGNLPSPVHLLSRAGHHHEPPSHGVEGVGHRH